MALDQGQPVPPPADLAQRALSLKSVSIDVGWCRIGKASYDPVHFTTDPGRRFSLPDLPGVLYLANEPETAFWEVFWDDLMTRPDRERRLDSGKLTERKLWILTLPREIRLVNTLDAAAMHELSAPDGTFQGPYDNCQAWAAALRGHPSRPDGLLYSSARRTGHWCLALFEEAFAGVRWDVPQPGVPLLESLELAAVIGRHGYPRLSS
jgi:hypothetical protein